MGGPHIIPDDDSSTICEKMLELPAPGSIITDDSSVLSSDTLQSTIKNSPDHIPSEITFNNKSNDFDSVNIDSSKKKQLAPPPEPLSKD